MNVDCSSDHSGFRESDEKFMSSYRVRRLLCLGGFEQFVISPATREMMHEEGVNTSRFVSLLSTNSLTVQFVYDWL